MEFLGDLEPLKYYFLINIVALAWLFYMLWRETRPWVRQKNYVLSISIAASDDIKILGNRIR